MRTLSACAQSARAPRLCALLPCALMSFALMLALAAAPRTAGAEEALGRFFSTPAERARLDRLRLPAPTRVATPRPARTPRAILQENPTPPPAEDLSVEEVLLVPDLPPPPPVSLQGFVKRSGGKNSVWVNGQMIPDAASQTEGAEVEVVAPDGTLLYMKPGQTHETASGQTRDVLATPQVDPE